MRTNEEVELIKKLYLEQGSNKNLCKIARDTGISRSTIRYILRQTSYPGPIYI